MPTYSSVWRPALAYDMPYMPSITGSCDGPMPRVKPGRPMAIAAARDAVGHAARGGDVYVCNTAVPSSIVVVARPAIAMAMSGSPRDGARVPEAR